MKQIYTLQTAYSQERNSYATDIGTIGFDNPGSTSRFTYTVPSTINVNILGRAQYVTGKGIKDLTGKELDPTKAIACVDTSSTQAVADATLGNLSNLSVTSNCQ